jgi:hypothetical protein
MAVLSPAERADLHAVLREWFRKQPRGATDLESAEQLAAAIGQVAAECAFECGVEHCGTRAGYQGAGCPCSCGAVARFMGYRRRWVRGLHGEVGVTRAYYHCRACGTGQVPWDRAQGLDRHVFTATLKARITELCARLPYREAKEVLDRYCGIGLTESTLEAVTINVGARLRQTETATMRQCFEEGRLPHGDPFLATVAGKRLYLSLDAAKAHTGGTWHDIKVAACYGSGPAKARPLTEGSEPLMLDTAGETRYLAVQEEAEAFGRRLYSWALRLGCERAGELVVLGDGAEWIWKLVREHFSDAVEILDFYHASEHVWAIARAVFGEQEARGGRWAKRHCRRLERQGPGGLLRGLRALERWGQQQGMSPEGREAVRLGREYFGRHQHRMAYPRFRAAGMMIGSGPVEAACKVVVGARLKQAGMRWSEPGADAMLAARTAVLARQYALIARHARAA